MTSSGPDLPSLYVSEIFGPTVQGEGRSAGTRAMFLRLGGCNLACSWCDTPYSWDWKKYDPRQELTRMTLLSIIQRLQGETDSELAANPPRLIVVTGGEPMLKWDRGLRKVVEALVSDSHGQNQVEIETNGTVKFDGIGFESVGAFGHPTSPRVSFNVSPKLSNSGDPEHKRLDLEALWRYAHHYDSTFKFVITAREYDQSLREVAELCGQLMLPPHRVWLMPEGTDTEHLDYLLGPLTHYAIDHGYNVSDRLHVRLWGNQRGV